jgi:hypothetical protein
MTAVLECGPLTISAETRSSLLNNGTMGPSLFVVGCDYDRDGRGRPAARYGGREDVRPKIALSTAPEEISLTHNVSEGTMLLPAGFH